MEYSKKVISEIMYILMDEVKRGITSIDYFTGMLNAYLSVGALNENDANILTAFCIKFDLTS